MWGSTVVLKKNTLSGPLGSGFTSTPSVVTGACTSFTNGTTLPRNSIMRRTPISFCAETQNTGQMLRSIKPLRIPSRISSSESAPCSKNLSIKVSSFSAAISTKAWFNSSARSLCSGAISEMVGAPPSGPQVSCFMMSTSTIELNPAPVATGNWIGTTLLPKASLSWLIKLS